MRYNFLDLNSTYHVSLSLSLSLPLSLSPSLDFFVSKLALFTFWIWLKHPTTRESPLWKFEDGLSPAALCCGFLVHRRKDTSKTGCVMPVWLWMCVLQKGRLIYAYHEKWLAGSRCLDWKTKLGQQGISFLITSRSSLRALSKWKWYRNNKIFSFSFSLFFF